MQAWTLVKPLLDRMIADGDVPPLIAVMPDAPYSQRGSYYVDSQYSVGFPLGRPVETAFLQDLLPHVDETYRTLARREARAVGGYSMGGYGALRYALAHPDLFMGALVLSPAVYTPLPPSDSSVREFGAFGLENELFVDEIYRQKNYPALLEALAQSEGRLTLFIAVGDDEWKHPRVEDQQHDLDLEAHLLFNRAVRVSQITAELRVLDGGHDWDVWRPAFAEGLPYLMRRMDLELPADASSSRPSEPDAETGVAMGATGTPPAPDAGDTTTLIGTPAEDLAGGVATADDGGLFVALAAGGSIDDREHAGGKDVVLRKFDRDGASLWTAQVGSSVTERPYGVAPDGESGAYVAGYTEGDLDGRHQGNADDDAFLARFDAQGQLLWVTQFGLQDVADRVYALAADAFGNAYVAGYTRGSLAGDNAGDKDVILGKFAADGTRLWLRQFGTWGEDKGLGLAVDAEGNVYVCGVVRGALAEPAGDFDAFLAAFGGDGENRWVRQFGSSGWDQAEDVVASASGDLYLTGMVAGDFAGPLAGDKDIFVARYSIAGQRLGAEQFGSEMNDKGADLALGQDGALYLAAFSNGDIAGQQGKFDVILGRYTADLQREWLLQLGGAADDGADAYAERNLFLALAGDDLVVSGLTKGGIAGQSPLGAGDVFLMRVLQ
jgi:S-formylglutathione hydrolase FrmB